MTLDEAIKHCEDVARLNEMYCDAEDSVSDRIKCAADHRKLADWLRELKERRAAVKRGYWKATMMSEATGWNLSLTGGRDEICEYNCSVCGKANILDESGENFLPPFCPWCGADMREKEGE